MEYCGVEFNDEGLQHYGVKGMHWGVRRYQPYPDGKFLSKFRNINKVNRITSNNIRDLTSIQYWKTTNRDSINKKTKKLEKYKAKNKTKKIEKIKAKIEKLKKDQEFLNNKKEEYTKEINRVIKMMDKKGYMLSDQYGGFVKKNQKGRYDTNLTSEGLVAIGKKQAARQNAIAIAQENHERQMRLQQQINEQNQMLFNMHHQAAVQAHMHTMGMW